MKIDTSDPRRFWLVEGMTDLQRPLRKKRKRRAMTSRRLTMTALQN